MRRRVATFAVVLVLAFGAALRAEALADYAADALSRLTIRGYLDGAGEPIEKPLDLFVEARGHVFDDFTSETGNGVASSEAEAAGDEDGTEQLTAVAGRASFPPRSSSAAEARTDGRILFDNESETETYRVLFELSSVYSVDAKVEAPATESALASVELALDSLSGGLLFALSESSDSALGGGRVADTATFSGSLVLLPGEFDELTLTSDALGSAAAVPEPGTLMLVGLGLLGLRARGLGGAPRPVAVRPRIVTRAMTPAMEGRSLAQDSNLGEEGGAIAGDPLGRGDSREAAVSCNARSPEGPEIQQCAIFRLACGTWRASSTPIRNS